MLILPNTCQYRFQSGLLIYCIFQFYKLVFGLSPDFIYPLYNEISNVTLLWFYGLWVMI